MSEQNKEELNITKVCKKCEVEKPIDNFNKQSKSKDGYKNYCKECFKLINNTIYIKNKKRIIKNVIRRRKEKNKLIRQEERLSKQKLQNTELSITSSSETV